MTQASAAAAEATRVGEPADLHTRLNELLERSSRGEAARLAERLLPTPSSATALAGLRHDGFYWLLIPEWLATEYGLGATAEGHELLDELCWIQYCVYGLFRVQDDLVDGDSSDARLAVLANHLVVEAAHCAARHFDGTSLFWRVFRETIDATSRTGVRLDRLQRTPERPPHVEIELYAELSSCLKIATAGVAIACGREHDWREHLSPALDCLAVAAQLVDDLRDLADDLRDGRINYAAWFLSRPVFGSTPEAIEAVVASNLAITDRLPALLGTAIGRMDEAVQLLERARCPRVLAYFVDYRNGIAALGEIIGRSRATLLRKPPAGTGQGLEA